MRISQSEQQAALSLHRTRNLLVKQRTQLVNMIRGLLAEFGIDIPEGLERALALAREIAVEGNDAGCAGSVAMQILGLLCGQVLDTHVRLQGIDRSICLPCKDLTRWHGACRQSPASAR